MFIQLIMVFSLLFLTFYCYMKKYNCKINNFKDNNTIKMTKYLLLLFIIYYYYYFN